MHSLSKASSKVCETAKTYNIAGVALAGMFAGRVALLTRLATGKSLGRQESKDEAGDHVELHLDDVCRLADQWLQGKLLKLGVEFRLADEEVLNALVRY